MAKKFFETKEFKDLNKEWAKKLEDSGFEDLEDTKGSLKADGERRTNTFDSQPQIARLFSKLDYYLHNVENPANIPERDRHILELFSDGIPIKGMDGIIEKTGWSDRTIRNTIAKYKKIIDALPDQETDEGEP